MMLSIFVVVSGCAHQASGETYYDPPGFFSGIWHGMVSPLALFFSMFSDIRIYAFPNSGFFYDLGFMIGVGSLVGGITSVE